ncbi:MAG TPA: hypothetical protein VN783_06505 [Thermoanaerobaculia bacterium]|nr:hypothetical protein [Thermoanaerobaculia bacterium]
MRRHILPLLAVLLLASRAALALSPYLVKDIDPRYMSGGSGPREFARAGNRVVFAAGPDESLYATTGAPGGVVGLGLPALGIFHGFTTALGKAFFAACATGLGCGLWSTDGTPQGTIRVADSLVFNDRLEILTPPGASRAYLAFDDGHAGSELWSTDGTRAGTRRAADVVPGFLGSRPRGLTWFRGRLWFIAETRTAHGVLFSSDGTPAGTRRFDNTIDGAGLAVAGNRLLYFGRRSGGVLGLWSTDGTTAPRPLAVVPAVQDLPSPISVAGSRGFFFAFPETGREVWTSDGTAAGTRRLLEAPFGGGEPTFLQLGAKVAFLAGDEARGVELWASDGSPAGTRRVRDVCPGSCSGAFSLGPVALGKIWFAGETPARGREVWTSDLTEAGTRLLVDACRGFCFGQPAGFVVSGPRVYFGASTSASGGGGSRLFASDGTPAGTRPVAALGFGFLFGAPFGAGGIVFPGVDEVHGVEPWISDGSAGGSRLIADVDSDNLLGSNPLEFFAAGGRCYFFASDAGGRALWSSDGTDLGTSRALEPAEEPDEGKDIRATEAGGRLLLFWRDGNFDPYLVTATGGDPATAGPLLPPGTTANGSFLRVGDRVFFVGTDPAHGAELWVTDGTPAGTLRLTDLVPPDPFRPEFAPPVLLGVGGRLVVPVLSAVGGEDLLISDGTPGGTRSLAEVYPFLVEPLAQATSDLVAVAGEMFFVAGQVGDGQATLWHTDLTAAGTGPVGPLDLSDPAVRGWSLFGLGGRLLLFGFGHGIGGALWASDGTAAGTRIVGPVEFERLPQPVLFEDRLWFAGRFGELWATDGTAAGTEAARDAADHGIQPSSLAVLGDRLVIATNSGFLASDGTSAGTLPIALPGGPSQSSGFLPVQVGERVFFGWSDGLHGPELWAIEP